MIVGLMLARLAAVTPATAGHRKTVKYLTFIAEPFDYFINKFGIATIKRI